MAGKDPASFGYDRALRLTATIGVEIKNDPIIHLVEFMRASGI
jgi:hypothetical protein